MRVCVCTCEHTFSRVHRLSCAQGPCCAAMRAGDWCQLPADGDKGQSGTFVAFVQVATCTHVPPSPSLWVPGGYRGCHRVGARWGVMSWCLSPFRHGRDAPGR